MIPFPVTIRLGKNAERFVFTNMRSPALFLDRDGIINVDSGYVGTAIDTIILTETCAAVQEANRNGIPVIVVSNQSGVGRQYFGWDMVATIDEVIANVFATHQATLDLILYAGCAPDISQSDPFRKPSPGLFDLAARLLSLDLEKSIMVGDKLSDLVAAARAGLAGGVLLTPTSSDIDSLATAFPHFFSQSAGDLSKVLLLALKYFGLNGHPA